MPKKIRTAKIANKMNEIGVELAIMKSLSVILTDLQEFGGCREEISKVDIYHLTLIALKQIYSIDEKFLKILKILEV